MSGGTNGNGNKGDNASGFKVQVFKLTNRLRKKLGLETRNDVIGYIDDTAIDKADRLIDKLCAECPEVIAGQLEQLAALWTKMRDMPRSTEREEVAQQMFIVAHEIKDLAAICGQGLTAYFAESLRDYVALTELTVSAQRVIIQAHIDALTVIQKQGLQDEDDKSALELKEMVRIAIEKYS